MSINECLLQKKSHCTTIQWTKISTILLLSLLSSVPPLANRLAWKVSLKRMNEHVYNSLGEWTHCTFSNMFAISFLTSIEWNAQDGLSIICTDVIMFRRATGLQTKSQDIIKAFRMPINCTVGCMNLSNRNSKTNDCTSIFPCRSNFFSPEKMNMSKLKI